jgi:hypothetical protein
MRHDGSSQLSVVRLTHYLFFGVAGHRIGFCSSSATSRVARQDVWLDRLFWTTGRLLNFAGNAGCYIRITDMMCGEQVSTSLHRPKPSQSASVYPYPDATAASLANMAKQ